MRASQRLEELVRAATRRPVVTLTVVVVLALGGALLALGLPASTGTDTFVSRSSSSYQVTADDQAHFGGDPLIVMIHEPLPSLVFTSELATVTKLEACLAGQTVVANAKLNAFTTAPAGSQPPYGGWKSPCGQLMRTKPVEVVYGPGTFLDQSVAAVNAGMAALLRQDQAGEASAARAAYQQALSQGSNTKQATQAAYAAAGLQAQQDEEQLAQLAVQSGIQSIPRIDDPSFITQIVFDQTRGVYQPKARFAYLFPTQNSALIQVRLKGGLSAAQQARAISLIRRAVKMPMFASQYGGTYTVSGAPVVVNDLAATLTHSIALLLVAAAIVMAIALLLVFRSPPRLLPLGLALAASGITFGLSALLGASLTMASIAVLPILIGLAVDYAVQFQSRVQEAGDHHGAEARAAVIGGARAGVPTIAVAALATAVGVLVLELSPVPMVRGFALLLVLGIAVALGCALTAGSAAMVLKARRDARSAAAGHGPVRDGRLGFVLREALQTLQLALQGAGELLRASFATVWGGLRRLWPRRAPDALRRLWPRRVRAALARVRLGPGLAAAARALGRSRLPVLQSTLTHPERVIALGAVLAVLGWAADTQTAVQSDVTKLVPASMPALRDLHHLERVTGVSGEIDVVVHAPNVATPQAIGWMIRYEQSLFAHYGYLETRGCSSSTVCPALSLPDLFDAGTQSPQQVAATLSSSSINSLLDAVPSYFRQGVITADRREATLAFGIRLMPLARQQRVIAYMRSQLHPPPGVTASLAGLPVLAAQANAALSSPVRRLLMVLAGLVAVGLALLAALRDRRRVLIALVPIVLATGWSAVILFAVRIPLNPMSASLGALVIAISTEFSVLLSERYRQERHAGHGHAEALSRTYRFTGAAVLASGLTAIAGFGVLVLSDIAMLRDFGLVTLIDLTVSLAGVIAVLPAVLTLSERPELRARAVASVQSIAARLPRPGRRARVA